jgi:hypothetical protein
MEYWNIGRMYLKPQPLPLLHYSTIPIQTLGSLPSSPIVSKGKNI